MFADFANELIGGGVFTGGNVQEETLFITRPDLLVALLLCAKMEGALSDVHQLPALLILISILDNEAIVISGATRFSSYSGSGSQFKFKGCFSDRTPLYRSLCLFVSVLR